MDLSTELQTLDDVGRAKWYTPEKLDNWNKKWSQKNSLVSMENNWNENSEDRKKKLRVNKFLPKDEKFYLYITPLETPNREKIDLNVEEFDWALSDLVAKPYDVKEVLCGLLVSLSKQSDINKILLMNFRKIFGCQVQIANISKNYTPYKKTVNFRTIPSTIALKEIKNCLTNQCIDYKKVERIDSLVKVEVHNVNQEERLLKEGINFYDAVSFPAIPEITGKHIIQCFKCQQFWRSEVNCVNVTCGDKHNELLRTKDVSYKSPLCRCFQ